MVLVLLLLIWLLVRLLVLRLRVVVIHHGVAHDWDTYRDVIRIRIDWLRTSSVHRH